MKTISTLLTWLEGGSRALRVKCMGQVWAGSQTGVKFCVVAFSGVSWMSFTIFLVFVIWDNNTLSVIVVVKWGNIGGVLSLASGTPVLGPREPVGWNLNFQFFTIPVLPKTWTVCTRIFFSGSHFGDSGPCWALLCIHLLLFHWDIPWFQGPAYPCGLCYCNTSSIDYQFFINCSLGGELFFLIWALCSRSVFSLFYWGNEKILRFFGGKVASELIGLIGQK